MTQRDRNRSYHMIKRLILFPAFFALMIWSSFSLYRFIPVIGVMLLVGNGPYYIHRRLTKGAFARDGFRLLAFFEPRGVFHNWSYDWPWWCELYGYDGVIVSESGEEFHCDFSIQGPFFATICPRIHSTIHALDIEVDNGEEVDGEVIARRVQNLRVLKCLNLDLSYSPMSDAELIYIENWENLESLSLSRTKVTDEGLKGCARLKNLSLSDPETTPDGRNALRRQLPECQIFPDP